MRVGLTFNLMHGEMEDTPDPSGTGSFELHVKYDVVETVKTAGGIDLLPQKANSRNLPVLVGGLPGPCSEGSLPSIIEHLHTPYTGSGYWTRQHLMKSSGCFCSQGNACVDGTGRA